MSEWNFNTLSYFSKEAEKRGVPSAKYAVDFGFDDLEGLELLRIRDRLRGFQADDTAASVERAKRSLQEFARNREDERRRLLDSIERGGDRA